MILLILGLALWIMPHLFKRVAPAMAAGIDEKKRKMGVTILSFVAIVLMVIGYRGWVSGDLYTPPTWGAHANNLLMMISIYLMAAAGMKTRITRVIRHPQSTGVILWSVAHLLANGDWASIVLFGALGLWAVAAIVLENAQKSWTKPAPAPMGKEIGAIVGTLIVVGVAGWIHIALGYHPFGG